jgi:hypothetical protein
MIIADSELLYFQDRVNLACEKGWHVVEIKSDLRAHDVIYRSLIAILQKDVQND